MWVRLSILKKDLPLTLTDRLSHLKGKISCETFILYPLKYALQNSWGFCWNALKLKSYGQFITMFKAISHKLTVHTKATSNKLNGLIICMS